MGGDIQSVVKVAHPDALVEFPRVHSASVSARPDPLRRFLPTPHALDLQFMQRTVRLETNQKAVANWAAEYFKRHQCGPTGAPEFRWRLICEPTSPPQSDHLDVSAFSDSALRFVNIGQRGFLAVDLDQSEGIGFLSEAFLQEDSHLKYRPPLDLLFCMTASSLGATAFSGACVGRDHRAVLIFGPPNSGKTTAAYLAARSGLEFHADQVVFVDTRTSPVRVWGDSLPAVFRPQTLEFLPELKESTHPSAYSDVSFHYFDKSPLQSPTVLPVSPVASVFLERGSGDSPELRELAKEDAAVRVREHLLCEEDPRFDGQVSDAVGALAARPAYAFRYDSDPQDAAAAIRELLQ